MAQNTRKIPFTELVERAAQIARVDGDLSRVRGAINDVYTREIPKMEDWKFLLVQSSITTNAEYKTGLATVNTGATAVTFSADTVLDATMTGRRIKFGTNSDVYQFTFSNATGGTINPPLSGTINVSNAAFSIFQNIYSLAPDFARFPRNGGLFMYQGGRVRVIPEMTEQEYLNLFTPSVTVPNSCRVMDMDTAGNFRVEIIPPPSNAITLFYEYERNVQPMSESSSGFVSVAALGTLVTGSAATTRFTEASTGWYFRVTPFGKKEDSRWYRINAITNDSSITLATAFALSAANSTGYVLSPAPEYPDDMHMSILYGAVKTLLADQSDQLFQYYDGKFTQEVIQAKKNYKARIFHQKIDNIGEEFLFRR